MKWACVRPPAALDPERAAFGRRLSSEPRDGLGLDQFVVLKADAADVVDDFTAVFPL